MPTSLHLDALRQLQLDLLEAATAGDLQLMHYRLPARGLDDPALRDVDLWSIRQLFTLGRTPIWSGSDERPAAWLLGPSQFTGTKLLLTHGDGKAALAVLETLSAAVVRALAMDAALGPILHLPAEVLQHDNRADLDTFELWLVRLLAMGHRRRHPVVWTTRHALTYESGGGARDAGYLRVGTARFPLDPLEPHVRERLATSLASAPPLLAVDGVLRASSHALAWLLTQPPTQQEMQAALKLP